MNCVNRANAFVVPDELRLLVVDDHQLVIDGLKVALSGYMTNLRMETARSTDQAMLILEKDQQFDLILLDLSLPGNRGIRLLRQISLKSWLIPVAILSASEEPEDVDLALASGACGFISKSASAASISQSVYKILEGKISLPDFYRRQNHRPDLGLQAAVTSITPRQLEVLQLLAQGLPNKKICTELNLTADTVKSHLKAIFSHLNVHNRTECVRIATKLNLVD